VTAPRKVPLVIDRSQRNLRPL